MGHNRKIWATITALGCCALLSCSDDTDAPILVDAGSSITGSEDSGVKRDAGSLGTPRVDAGSAPSEANADAGSEGGDDMLDSGTKAPTDAGKADAGKADAGKADAGKADAGKADAGGPRPDSGAPVKQDAGTVADSGTGTPVVDSGTSEPAVDSGTGTPVVDSGAPVVDSGTGTPLADSGMPGDAGAYVRSAACQSCLDLYCTNYLGAIPTLANCVDSLCLQIVSCAEQSKCVKDSLTVTNCYCGDVTLDECTVASYTPNGVCKGLIEQGLMTTVKDTVLERYIDMAYVGGNANYLLTCEAESCSDPCLK